MRLAFALATAVCLAVLSGCGDQACEVSGSVLIDGEPMAEGEIIFEAADGKTTPAAGPVKDGKYAVAILPGAKVVRVTASRPTAIPDPVMGAAAKESMVLPEFNTKSTLTADLKAGKQDGVNFEVKSIPAAKKK